MWKQINQELYFLFWKNKLVVVIFIYLGIALWRLDTLPGEWYGDISNVHEYVMQIQRGERPFYFFQSAGPVYHYLITPIVSVLGQDYLGYKIASVIIGAAGLIGIYLMAQEIVGLGFWTTLVAATSFWYLVWARVGNSQIIIPVLTALTIYWGNRFRKSGGFRELSFGLMTSLVGLLVYPQTFILPIVFGIWIFSQKRPSGIVITILSTTIISLIVNAKVWRFKENGYVNSKIPNWTALVSPIWVKNWTKTLGMLYVSGDQTFRINIPGKPHIDPLSGLLLAVGIILVLKQNTKTGLLLLFSGIIILLPSTSPALPYVEIPNSGRAIGIIPIISLFIAQTMQTISKRKIAVLIIFGFIIFYNLNQYFVSYPKVLPNQNVPYGKIIASYIDTLPKTTKIKLAGCCWGDWGQAEPKGIYYQLKNQLGRENIVHDQFISRCEELDKNTDQVIIGRPNDENIAKLSTCSGNGKLYVNTIFSSVYLKASIRYR